VAGRREREEGDEGVNRTDVHAWIHSIKRERCGGACL
jgi:hypothetical protein